MTRIEACTTYPGVQLPTEGCKTRESGSFRVPLLDDGSEPIVRGPQYIPSYRKTNLPTLPSKEILV